MNLRFVTAVLATCYVVSYAVAQQEKTESQNDSEPVLIHKVEAEYPEEAKEAGVAGEVVLRIRIETDGTTTILETLKPLGHGCTEAAINAAEQWKWEPAEKNGKSVEAEGIIKVSFTSPEKKERQA